jgi:PHD/YefM family antitoxin component YafN of YafNO toxin-antitoxin module
MSHITANDLKTKGIAAIEAVLQDQTEAIVSVRGHARFVVMDLEHYQHLRQCELETALIQSRADVAAGRFVDESAEQHVARIKKMIETDCA